ncbi:Lysine-specific demethylase 4c-like protein [Seiridium cupressi]
MAPINPTRDAFFKGWNSNRLHKQRIGGSLSPVHIHEYRLDPKKWSNGRARKSRQRRRASSVAVTVDCILGQSKEELTCLVCSEFPENCKGSECYAEWRLGPPQRLRDCIEIRDTGTQVGDGAFVKPGRRVKKGKYLGEYLGELLPPDSEVSGMYTFDIRGVARVHAGACGNLTRFFNHSCQHNVDSFVELVGGRQIIVFQAKRDIEENEQILINYGAEYFRDNKLACACTAEKCRFKQVGQLITYTFI